MIRSKAPWTQETMKTGTVMMMTRIVRSHLQLLNLRQGHLLPWPTSTSLQNCPMFLQR